MGRAGNRIRSGGLQEGPKVPFILPLGCRTRGCDNAHMAWRTRSPAKYDGKYHCVWCPKRRRWLGGPEIRAFVPDTFRVVAKELDFWTEELAIEEDHVRVLLEQEGEIPS